MALSCNSGSYRKILHFITVINFLFLDYDFSLESLALAANILRSVQTFASDCGAFLKQSSGSYPNVDSSLLLTVNRLNQSECAVFYVILKVFIS